MNYTQKQKGSLYLTVVLLGIVLAITVGVIGIVVNGSNLVKGLGDSVRAFHIADSGIEEVLYRLRRADPLLVPPTPGNFFYLNPETNDFSSYGTSNYDVLIKNEAGSIVIQSTGSYNGSQRRIQATY